ncbi:serine hydrolase, partial [candidate division KSB1 bacterium]|nr:serine hydrolase [candidate division KSB1 bacterium]
MPKKYIRTIRVRLSVFVLFGQLSLIVLTGQNCAQEPAKTVSAKVHADPEKLVSGLENLIPQLMDKAQIPGLSIALIKDAEVLWNGSFGVKSLESNQAVNDSTIFQAASLSKAVFAYAVLKMVERGDLLLDTPLSHYLPDYVDDERIDQITARIVLSHTTGFPNWRPRDGDLEIHFMPGSKFSYSGEGYVYLQKVIEHITGLTLNEFMKQNVFEPLGM